MGIHDGPLEVAELRLANLTGSARSDREAMPETRPGGSGALGGSPLCALGAPRGQPACPRTLQPSGCVVYPESATTGAVWDAAAELRSRLLKTP
jgi:hypothetical protein